VKLAIVEYAYGLTVQNNDYEVLIMSSVSAMKRLRLLGMICAFVIASDASSSAYVDTNGKFSSTSNPKNIDDDQILLHAPLNDETEENYAAYALIPPAIWLFSSGLLLLTVVARRKKA
jgi:hypothetical protein